jgi:hypothetical protein
MQESRTLCKGQIVWLKNIPDRRESKIPRLIGRAMSLITICVVIGQWAAIAGCCVFLNQFTPLPFWAVFLISLPVGTLVGALAGTGLGVAIDFALQKLRKFP